MTVPAGGFALLDDCAAAQGDAAAVAAAPAGRLLTGFVAERRCADPALLDAFAAQVDADLAAGLHAVLLIDYEFGAALQCVPAAGRGAGGVARALLFASCARLDAAAADAWLAASTDAGDGGASPAPAGIANLSRGVERAGYDAALDAIHAALVDGEAYQVNYTYPLDFDAFGDPRALYRRLRARQPVQFGALIALPDGGWVASLSPELFVEHRAGRLRTRPMKGTAPRHPADAAADRREAEALRASAKNRAENLMIVDLLRNDFGRIARTGSVRVPALFDVEPYPSVWQMTSTVEADLDPACTLADVLRALFPCGSITGAPKRRAMQFIAELEAAPRGLYTGAIGWLDARDRNEDGVANAACRLGVGGGIVLDSDAQTEWDESGWKAHFLTGMDPGFALLETMFATRAGGVRHLDRHLARLRDGARYFGFAFDEVALRADCAARIAALDDAGGYRLRLTLSKSGAFELAAVPLAPSPAGPVTVGLAAGFGCAPTDSRDLFLRYKTTHRARYDDAWRAAERAGAFDLLFTNEKGELTEGGRTSVFVKLDGRWWTPPLASGVLPGVMRGALLDDPAWGAGERVLWPDDLRRADALMVCNALRGALPAQLLIK